MYLVVDTGILLALIGNDKSKVYVFPVFKVRSRKRISGLRSVDTLDFFVFHNFLEDPQSDEFRLSDYPDTIKYYKKNSGRDIYIFTSGFYVGGLPGLTKGLLNTPDDTELIKPYGHKYFERLIGPEKAEKLIKKEDFI